LSGKSRLLGLLLTIVFLALAFSRVDLAAVVGTLRQANYLLVMPATLITLCGYLLRSRRWQAILTEGTSATFSTLFSVLMIGFASNNVLPARLGELVRAVLLQRRTGLRKTYSIATIFLERLFDGLLLIAILWILSLSLRLVGFSHELQIFTSVLFVGATIGLLVLLAQERFATAVLGFVLRPAPERAASWIRAAFSSFLLGLRAVRRPSVLGLTLASSVGVWFCEWLSYYSLTYAFDFPLGGAQRVLACGMLLVFVNLGIMIPSAPGYVGTFQFFAVEALAMFQVPRELALSLAIVAHAQQYLLVTAIGAYFVTREHLSWRSLTTGADADDASGPEQRVEPVGAGGGRE
jgi:glycosyltransferase 2 family protein